ncbi:hypothetical protein [Levilactobacillus brevis]|jgi:hypothetical protein|uniref:Uncharacterized protein n=1 Tax=Levilactobacillus brevis TaxID=1580 RepID=A0AB38X8P1_LEVBR|nr:hypothetical protein [Levilactobacillus brevis]AWP47700.1 hypothetical protein CCS05_12290 [Levilactobacillus brevis]KID43097.1 hypothetical protein LbDm2_2006 [Levilactobacillus brevis]MBY7145722.1 hypothetical protein [Levilactobacillus brevis]MCE6027800.1 hypothetical protein [Levilactobacillus brevis]MCT3577445.1 hypothetical protein [Levilactobacillus brevis]
MATNLENKLAKLQRANEEYQAAKKKLAQDIGLYAIEKMDIDSLKDFKSAVAPLLTNPAVAKPTVKGDDPHV